MKNTSSVTRNYMLAIMLVSILCITSGARPEKITKEATVMEKRYKNWMKQHSKTYENKEEWNMRFGIYQSNLKYIEFINAQNLSYKLTDNQFADMTNFEFQTTYLGYKSRKHSHKQQHSYKVGNYALPSSIDWRKRGAVTSVKNQGSCGTIYFFCYCCFSIVPFMRCSF